MLCASEKKVTLMEKFCSLFFKSCWERNFFFGAVFFTRILFILLPLSSLLSLNIFFKENLGGQLQKKVVKKVFLLLFSINMNIRSNRIMVTAFRT